MAKLIWLGYMALSKGNTTSKIMEVRRKTRGLDRAVGSEGRQKEEDRERKRKR